MYTESFRSRRSQMLLARIETVSFFPHPIEPTQKNRYARQGMAIITWRNDPSNVDVDMALSFAKPEGSERTWVYIQKARGDINETKSALSKVQKRIRDHVSLGLSFSLPALSSRLFISLFFLSFYLSFSLSFFLRAVFLLSSLFFFSSFLLSFPVSKFLRCQHLCNRSFPFPTSRSSLSVSLDTLQSTNTSVGSRKDNENRVSTSSPSSTSTSSCSSSESTASTPTQQNDSTRPDTDRMSDEVTDEDTTDLIGPQLPPGYVAKMISTTDDDRSTVKQNCSEEVNGTNEKRDKTHLTPHVKMGKKGNRTIGCDEEKRDPRDEKRNEQVKRRGGVSSMLHRIQDTYEDFEMDDG